MLSLYPYEPQHAQEQHSFNGSSECEHIKIPQTNRLHTDSSYVNEPSFIFGNLFGF